VRFAGTESWSISIRQWSQQLEWPLWFRAAERIDAPVIGPLDIDPLPERSVAASAELVEGWLAWWRELLAREVMPARPEPADLNRFGPPDFEGLAGHPALRRVVAARWEEANEWHANRKGSGVDQFWASGANERDREGTIVRAVEAEVGHKAAPFSVWIVVLPVRDEEIRSAGQHLFLVPERLHATSAYEDWLRKLVRALA
jgi:hypothetical protein